MSMDKFQRQGFVVLMVCVAVMLGVGLYMFVVDIDSTSIVTSRYHNPTEKTISWQTPIFAAIILLILGLLTKIYKPALPKMNIQEKRAFIFGKIADFFWENDFKKRGNHFFKRNGSVADCVNIQNDKWNNAEPIRFTLNFGVFTDSFWLQHYDSRHIGVVPSFPKEYECAVRKRIGSLLPADEDRWYCIVPDTDVLKLWGDIEHELTDYAMPFFAEYNTETDIVPNQCI